MVFILLFAIGHCIPIVIAGSSTAMVKSLLANNSWQQSGRVFKRLAGTLIALLGVYFIVQPFFSA